MDLHVFPIPTLPPTSLSTQLKKMFFKDFFLCGPFLKSLLNLLQYCFCFMFWYFAPEACGILTPQPGIKTTLLALEGEVLTTGPLGKSWKF